MCIKLVGLIKLIEFATCTSVKWHENMSIIVFCPNQWKKSLIWSLQFVFPRFRNSKIRLINAQLPPTSLLSIPKRWDILQDFHSFQNHLPKPSLSWDDGSFYFLMKCSECSAVEEFLCWLLKALIFFQWSHKLQDRS